MLFFISLSKAYDCQLFSFQLAGYCVIFAYLQVGCP
jgi:hypothetical protein